MTKRIGLVLMGTLAAIGLLKPSSLTSATLASTVEIGGTRTVAEGVTAASGARAIQLKFAATLINGTPDLSDDVEVGWQEVGGIDPTPFRILIPAGCFVTGRRGARVVDFGGCGVQMSLQNAAGVQMLLTIVDFDAANAKQDDGSFRLRIVTTFIPPDPVIPPDPIVPPDPVHEFLGTIGGAAVQIAIGSEATMVSPPLRAATVSGVEPQPF